MSYLQNRITRKEFIPNQEFYDKVVAVIKADSHASRKEKTASKKEPMSDVSRRYF